MAGIVLLATEQVPAAIPRGWGIPFYSFTRAPEYYTWNKNSILFIWEQEEDLWPGIHQSNHLLEFYLERGKEIAVFTLDLSSWGWMIEFRI